MGKKKSPPSFDEYYKEIYQERWQGLKESCLGDTRYYNIEGLLGDYFIDEASKLVVDMVKPVSPILDMCSAPGGKMLYLLAKMTKEGNYPFLLANEYSANRKARLVKNSQLLPKEAREKLQITHSDASLWGKREPESFQTIILDAPCSSERHLLNNPKLLKEWTPGRSKNLAIRQKALLCSAIDALKEGGVILYITCALTPLENDSVIEKTLKKREGVNLLEWQEGDPLRVGEKTEWGYHILPDRYNGIGPIYYTLLKKGGL